MIASTEGHVSNPAYNGPDFRWQVRVRPSTTPASRAFDTSAIGRHFDLGAVGFIKKSLTRDEAEAWVAAVLAWSNWSKHTVTIDVEPYGGAT